MSRTTEPIQARIPTDWRTALDAWGARRGLSRNAAVNLILHDRLTADGALPPATEEPADRPAPTE